MQKSQRRNASVVQIKMEEIMKKKLLFNPEGNDCVTKRSIIKGNTTNLFNLNDVKYSWASEMYRVMMSNFWVPEKVDLTKDVLDYKQLTEEETKAFDGIISFLTFLDSIQTNNVPNIADYITAPEVSTILAIQTYQEAIHSQSYAYILETVIPKIKREEVYEYWRTDTTLLKRNQYIATKFQSFIDEPSNKNFARVILADYILEGLYFYNGFAFFYNLASRNLLLGIADEIRYINRDELTHVVLFRNIIKELIQEFPGLITEDLVYEMFRNAVEEEIAWSTHILGSNILGINANSIEKYTKYLANERIKLIGFKPLYPGYEENPYAHLERLSDKDNDSMKSNFFESTTSGYAQSNAIDGWDEF